MRRRLRYVPTRVDGWDIPDPAGKTIEEVREIRDLVEGRITELIHEHIDESSPIAPHAGGGARQRRE